MEYDVDSYV